MKVGQSVGVLFGSSKNPTSGPDTNAKPAKKKMQREKFKFIEEMDNIFDLDLDLCGSLPDLYWKGSIVKPTAAPVTTLPPLQIIKEVIWEIMRIIGSWNSWPLITFYSLDIKCLCMMQL